MALNIEENVSLRLRNTLGLRVTAAHYCRAHTVEELLEALAFAQKSKLGVFILGGGSNVVLLKDLIVLVISIEIKGCEFAGNRVTAMAGENWNDFVKLTIDRKLYGLENLSLIPGLVGAAPIQNIGAYGVELSDRFVELTAVDRTTGEIVRLDKAECQFAYRDSVFKQSLRNRLVIASVTLALDADYCPVLSYDGLKDRFSSEFELDQVNAEKVRDAVIDIRLSKLPDPNKTGNVGSFFKNPVVSFEQWEELHRLDRSLKSRKQNDGGYKLSAAVLIERAGLKQVSVGDACVSQKHALVIVNQGTATGRDVMLLADKIIHEVRNRFNITLEIEPVVVS